jgi:hypothetical protein
MIYEIAEPTKKRAAKCPYSLECLSNDKWNTCYIEDELSGGLSVKKICTQKFCNYFLYFGSRHICICPVRVEIYRRYNI